MWVETGSGQRGHRLAASPRPDTIRFVQAQRRNRGVAHTKRAATLVFVFTLTQQSLTSGNGRG
jgi:hypothetical protein